LVDKNNRSERILIGYIEGGTNGFDTFYDIPSGYKNTLDLFSITENKHIKTQGRKLPFDSEDKVPIGYNAPQNDNYTFALAAIDGLFTSQNIYIKDLLLNVTHDLKASPYQFYSESGYQSNRFVLVYQNNLLSLPNHLLENTIEAISVDNEIQIHSSRLFLTEIKIYDLLGRLLVQKKNINSKEISLSDSIISNQLLLIEIKTEDGKTVVKKITNSY
jgi:hypothetical protein